MNIGYMIALARMGKPLLYFTGEFEYDSMERVWREEVIVPIVFSPKELEEKIKQLLADFREGNGEDDEEALFVGHVMTGNERTYGGNGILDGLAMWTKVGEKIEGDFELQTFKVNIDLISIVRPFVEAARVDAPPKSPPVPIRSHSTRQEMRGDYRMIIATYRTESAFGVSEESFAYPLEYRGREEVTKVGGVDFEHSEWSPKAYVHFLHHQMMLLEATLKKSN